MPVDGATAAGDMSEDDVFGRGGGLDDNRHVRHEPHRADEGPERADVDPPATRKKRGNLGLPDLRDFAAEAIARLGNSLTRRDMDATGRMDRLRQRVRDREGRSSIGDGRAALGEASGTDVGAGGIHTEGGEDPERQARLAATRAPLRTTLVPPTAQISMVAGGRARRPPICRSPHRAARHSESPQGTASQVPTELMGMSEIARIRPPR